MSRVRRGDAKLYFPDRVVKMHRTEPTPAELELIRTIAEPIQKLNRLAQISILQALTSSPDALNAQLANMARKGTVPNDLSLRVKSIVEGMPRSAKLRGLGSLIQRLKKENPDRWRLVVFTGRRETQTTIQSFLEGEGLAVGIINGDSGDRNQETITKFRENPPKYRVIVSTEAGSEGVNLQVANVLVNYDLPWNPMIVEQRIGRIQRLASQHAHVSIFNIMLRGTFEEYIVGRLMEKLQMASHAIGDIESLLQASDVSDDDGDGATGFEEKILALVLAALAGKDVEQEARLAERSIADARETLEREEAGINELLGSMEGAEYVGPRAPDLPATTRSMAPKEFTLAALRELGAVVVETAPGLYEVTKTGLREFIRFDDAPATGLRSTLYDPSSPAFQRLVDEVVATGLHGIRDVDEDPARKINAIAQSWVHAFGANFGSIETRKAIRSFSGDALLRVRATVAHDAYERLVAVHCLNEEHFSSSASAASPMTPIIERPEDAGLSVARLREAAEADEAISEFARFYLERREQEMRSAMGDERKSKKLEDDFTPRLAVSLVGASGQMRRETDLLVHYSFDGSPTYESSFRVIPSTGAIVGAPELRQCARLGRQVPAPCLARCEASGMEVLRHFLMKSDVSNRRALAEHTTICSYSGKRVLTDETGVSTVTGRVVAKTFLKRSAISGAQAEPEHFGRCEFTNSEVLKTELAVSEFSGKNYLTCDKARSASSGKTGHKSEFIECYETRASIGRTEAEACQVTGRLVRQGVLETCAITAKRVLPSELRRCSVTSKRALKTLFVSSSLSQTEMLEEVAIRSAAGRYCLPIEAQPCGWSERKFHPDDLKPCTLVGLTVHFSFLTETGLPRLKPLAEMLDGTRKSADSTQLWTRVTAKMTNIRKAGKLRVEAATSSPSGHLLAVSVESKTWLGLQSHQVGAIFDPKLDGFVGRVVEGKRRGDSWIESH